MSHRNSGATVQSDHHQSHGKDSSMGTEVQELPIRATNYHGDYSKYPNKLAEYRWVIQQIPSDKFSDTSYPFRFP